jgi:hypothetical protein
MSKPRITYSDFKTKWLGSMDDRVRESLVKQGADPDDYLQGAVVREGESLMPNLTEAELAAPVTTKQLFSVIDLVCDQILKTLINHRDATRALSKRIAVLEAKSEAKQ